jgi:uncharacterized protein (TIGR00159 family)
LQIRARRLLVIISIFFLIYFLSKVFNLSIAPAFLSYFTSFGLVLFFIVFQKEIRRAIFSLKIPLFPLRKIHKHAKEESIIHEILEALEYFSQNKIGAILVFKNVDELVDLISGGVPLNSEINSKILISIFQKESPLHDGAVIIDKNKIKYASVILLHSEHLPPPLTEGTRHRAGLGITEESDAMSIIVSEETGKISFAQNGKLYHDVSLDFIRDKLLDYYEFPQEKVYLKTLLKFQSIIFVYLLALLFSFLLWLINNLPKFK